MFFNNSFDDLITELQFIVWKQDLSVYKVRLANSNVEFDSLGTVCDFGVDSGDYATPLFF